ncbi:MAG: histidine kinase, partial [Butyrivibrio sp.]|nr:histidine kinase [Butyrivibrio sp.]
AQERAAIVMTQIQPHFLYNTLNTIYHLCGSAPKKAQTATGLFSDYLRENLESINRRTPVPFSMELKHIKTYLELEQMRFEERLRVVYDIRTDAFLLPPLTVQPIVENAVRHGIGKRVEGGTVTIATNEADDTFDVTVTDDGVGLETLRKRIPASEKGGVEKAGSEPDRAGKKRSGAEREEKHTGIGIENVRIRLKEISNGTLTLEEVPGGQGVTVRISIPKHGNRV